MKTKFRLPVSGSWDLHNKLLVFCLEATEFSAINIHLMNTNSLQQFSQICELDFELPQVANRST